MHLKTAALATCLVAAGLNGCSETKTTTTATPTVPMSGEPGVKMQVSPAVRAMANNPTPPPNAKQATSIGKGPLSVDTKNSPTDTDSVWVQQIDLNGDGTAETADVLWDDEDKVLFLYGEGDFFCRNGGVGRGAMLVALNGPANPRNRPVGSGFFAVLLDESECSAHAAGIWGCKFDANGNVTACGWVTIDATKDDLIITEGVAN
ncbi:MAG: hypothetical protein U0575_13685 [Phycisphaerales bacterium]|jgi:hypothetical protein